jgi:predicted aspartyl protease
MPTIEGRLDDTGFPLVDLQVVPSARTLAMLIDTGFDGELMLYHDDLRAAGIEAVFDHDVQVRLADGTLTSFLGTTLTIEWFGQPRRISVDVVPAIRPAHAYPVIGCRLLRDSRLEIDFPRRTVLVTRA